MPKFQSVSSLSFKLIDTKRPKADEVDLCESAFELWKSVWADAFKELKVASSGCSDDFLSRELSGLFHNGKAVGLFFNDWFNLTPSQIAHSYFKNYPAEVFEFLRKKDFKKFMTLSYMTIHPDWRKENTDLPLSEILFSLGIKRFDQTGYEALVGYIRKDKGHFEQVFERHGGIMLLTTEAYNVGVDFRYVTQQSKQLSSVPGVSEFVEQVWDSQFRKLKVA